MDTIQIRVTPQQFAGVNFAFDPLLEKEIIREFPGAIPLWKVLIACDVKDNFDFLYERVAKYILPAMLGLADERDFKKIKRLEFIESLRPNKLLKTFDLEA